MPNSVQFAQKFIPMLDEVYKNASLTAQLDGADELARQGANANEMVIPMLSMQGMADYDPNSGYVQGDVTLTNQTVKCNYDRGRMFAVDTVEDADTAGIYFGRLAGEFIRTRVVPELDAFRFAAYAGAAHVGKKQESLASGTAVLTALREASTKMDEAEVPMEDRHLFITPTLQGMIADLDATKSRAVLDRFASVTLVPQSRFYTKIELTADGEGGYKKAADGGADINFMILHREALIQFEKHVAPKIVEPAQNQTADAYKFGYRCVGIAQVCQQKAAGVYVSHKAAA